MKLSIITINKDNSQGLLRTIKSVSEQTFLDFEFIIIDGASTDGSVEIIKQHANTVISYYISEPDSGIYNAMNKGIKKARGNYLLFLNSGDYLINKDVLSIVFTQIGNTNSDFIFCDSKVINRNTHFVKKNPRKLNFLFFYYDSVCHQSTFIKKSLFDEIEQYDESLKIMSDWKFVIVSLCKYNKSYTVINEVVSAFNMEGISGSKNSRQLMKEEREKVLKENFSLFYDDYVKLHSYYKWSLQGILQRLKYKYKNITNCCI